MGQKGLETREANIKLDELTRFQRYTPKPGGYQIPAGFKKKGFQIFENSVLSQFWALNCTEEISPEKSQLKHIRPFQGLGHRPEADRGVVPTFGVVPSFCTRR